MRVSGKFEFKAVRSLSQTEKGNSRVNCQRVNLWALVERLGTELGLAGFNRPTALLSPTTIRFSACSPCLCLCLSMAPSVVLQIRSRAYPNGLIRTEASSKYVSSKFPSDGVCSVRLWRWC